MTFISGARLGHYEVTGKLGEGGMGEVYRGRDTKLDRDVAIKVLPESFATDADRVARFTREAKTLASLNHPNIAAIYGIEEFREKTSGVFSGSALSEKTPDVFSRALVMELVEGRDLSQMIGGLEVQAALRIARQIIDALEAAHEQGIIHRDLKPQNIKVREDGTVKVLDFGLAKATDPGAPGLQDSDKSPTMTARATQLGMIIGTAAYMSPEQARGKPVDKRADIWAFGVVLYEMLTGQRAFHGEDISVTLANVIKEDPKWDALPAEVPASIRRLLRRCLEKEPKRRLSAIADARLELDELDAPASVATTAPPPRPSAWIAIAAVATIAALALAVVTFVTVSKRPSAAGVSGRVEVPVFLPEGVSPGASAVSPDGRHVVFSAVGTNGNARLWIRSLDTAEARPLAGGDGGVFPFWAPDGRRLAFLSPDGKLRRLDLDGGTSLVLGDAGSFGGAWAADDTILFSGDGHRLLRVPASGGTPSEVALDDGADGTALRGFPQFLTDGRRFLYGVVADGGLLRRAQWRVGSLDAPTTTPIPGLLGPVNYTRDSQVLFFRGSMLMAQRFDEERLTLVGDATPVAPDAAPGTLVQSPSFAFGTTGTTLAYVTTRLGSHGQLTWFDRAGKALGSIAQPAGEEFLNPSLSPDATRLAVNRVDATGNWDIWVIDLRSGITSRVTSDPAQDSDAVWSPDGNDVAYVSNRGDEWGIYRKSLRGGGTEQLVVKTTAESRVTDWTRDGFLVYSLYGLDRNIMAVPLSGATRTPVTIAGTPFFEHAGHVSPDGKWIAFQSNDTGVGEIYIQPFPGPGERTLISHERGLHPTWRGDGRELIYWGNDSRLMSVDLRYDAAGVHASAPKFILPPEIKVLTLVDSRPHYAVTPDGQRFLVRQPLGPAGPPIKVILNWAEGLRK